MKNMSKIIYDGSNTISLKFLDNVFHNVIIALERLEIFLEILRGGEKTAKFTVTGINTSRDIHDDVKNPPTFENVLGEVELQCMTLFFQTKFDDEMLFKKTMAYFMTDLLEWYGGRGPEIPYDEVEKSVLVILVALSRQVDSVVEIRQVFDNYVSILRYTEDFSDEKEEKAVLEGFNAYLLVQHRVGEQMQEFEASDGEVRFTGHKWGSALDGYKRLMDAMINLYDTTTPAKKVRTTFAAYVEGLPEFTDEAIEAAFASRGQNKKPLEQDVVTAADAANVADESNAEDAATNAEDESNAEEMPNNCFI